MNDQTANEQQENTQTVRPSLSDELERALRLIKDSLPPYERDTNFQEFHISFGNGIVLRDANGGMICSGYKRIADRIISMRSNEQN